MHLTSLTLPTGHAPHSRLLRRRRPSLHAFPLSVYPVQIWLAVLILLIVLHDLLLAPPAPVPPPSRIGTPASRLTPAAYYSSNARFVFHTAAYGQFNNQLVSLFNALFIARRADAILVLPYAALGKESTWDARHRNITDVHAARELVGHYFNYSALRRVTPVARPSHFFPSADGRLLLDAPTVTVAYRSGGYFRRLFKYASVEYLHRKRSRVDVLSPAHPRARLDHACDFEPDHALATVNHQGRNGRFTMLPIVFRRHNLNCTLDEPHWLSLRRALVPRDEFLTAVDAFLESVRKPVFSVHLRFFLNGDIGNFTPRSVVDMLFREYGKQLMQARTVFVAYSPSSEASREVFAQLKDRFHGDVVDGSRSASFFAAEHSDYTSMALSAVLFDMWVCVKSDIFVGRLGSSLSWNVVYWRQALWKDYGLDRDVVWSPLWYQLANFTTTGSSRKEGPLQGVRYMRD